MKKTISLFFTLLFISASFAQTIEKTYIFGIPQVKDFNEFQILNLENTLNCGITGEPLLPYQDVRLLLPPGQRAVSIEFVYKDETTIVLNSQIYPQQSSKPLSQPEKFQFKKSEYIYSNDSFYPTAQTGKLITQYLNGYAFALSSFTPVRYNPVTGELRIYRKVTIRISTEDCLDSDEALNKITNVQTILHRISQFAQNAEMLKEYPQFKESSENYEMLIITQQDYIAEFQQLEEFYLQVGIKSTITSVEDIDAGMYGDDLQEKIRNYIIDEYQNRQIRFVLLGGDTEIVPARGFYAFVNSGEGYEDYNIPADLYYSALDGNWDNDGDLIWGELGEEDFLPEVAVGRFSFSNSEELANMIHKTISYQSNPVLGEFNDVLFAGEQLWDDPLTLGSHYLETLIGNQNINGYETTAIPETYNFERLYDEVEYWDGYSLMAAVNSGKQYVHHVGHADFDYVSFMYNYDITDENFSEANGIAHNYTIFHTHGCNCGGFDADDCILERMVCINNFAVAVIGNSRFGWFNEGQSEGPAIHLHREMMDAVYDDGIYHLGEAFLDSKIQTAPWITAPGQWEEGALKWNFYDINILGDPSLAIWTEEPVNLVTDYENILQIDATQTNVNVTINSAPASELNCVIIKNGIMHGRGITDESGNALISIEPAFTEIGSAQLIVSGNNCKPTIYSINIENSSLVNQSSAKEFSVFPNPAQNFIDVCVPVEFGSNNLISIFNESGQLVYQGTTNALKNKIEVTNFKNGFYIVNISNESKTITSGFTKLQ